ncbi:hypothetical protein M9458_033321, partial [Cirrhinus mrigala]
YFAASQIQQLLEHRSTMNPASRLLCLRQGNQAIEEYVEDFCNLCHLVDFNDVALKGIFCNGLKDNLYDLMPDNRCSVTLQEYIDYALLLAGSPFTVGIADKEPCNPTVPITSEHFHTPTFMSRIVNIMPETTHAKPAKPKSAHVTSAESQPAHAMPAAPGPAHAMPAAPGLAHTMPALPESAPVMAAIPEPVHKMAAIPEPVHKMAAIPKPVHKMVAPSESPAKMAATPKPHQSKSSHPNLISPCLPYPRQV